MISHSCNKYPFSNTSYTAWKNDLKLLYRGVAHSLLKIHRTINISLILGCSLGLWGLIHMQWWKLESSQECSLCSVRQSKKKDGLVSYIELRDIIFRGTWVRLGITGVKGHNVQIRSTIFFFHHCYTIPSLKAATTDSSAIKLIFRIPLLCVYYVKRWTGLQECELKHIALHCCLAT